MFKKLCVVGIGSCFGSLTPILCWMILGKIHGTEFSNGMSYTYPYQFLFLLTFGIFFRGNIKGELTNNSTDNNKSRTGILLGFITAVVLSIVSLCLPPVMLYLGVTTSVGKWAFAYGMFSMAIDWSAYYCLESYAYNGYEKKFSECISSWYIEKLVFVLFTAIPIFDYRTAVIFILTAQFTTLVSLYWKNAKPTRITWSVIYGFKYTLSSTVSDMFMMIIYILGIHTVASGSDGYLAAFNTMVFCTDTQWDVAASATDIVVTQHACDGTYEKNKKNIFTGSFMFHILLFLSSFFMLIGCMFLFKDINYKIAFSIFAIEMLVFPLYAFKYVMGAYVCVKNPNIMIMVFSLLNYVIRLAVQQTLATEYAVSIAVPASLAVGLLTTTILYKKARKVQMNE